MADISSVDRKTSFFGSKPPDSRPHMRVEDEMAVERKYTFGDVLGQGSFGVVREVTSRASGERFAIKIVHKDKVSYTATSRTAQKFRRWNYNYNFSIYYSTCRIVEIHHINLER